MSPIDCIRIIKITFGFVFSKFNFRRVASFMLISLSYMQYYSIMAIGGAKDELKDV